MVVTGADGFIGRALCAHLAASQVPLRTITRASHGDLASTDDAALDATLAGASAVIHLAGRAHVMVESAPDAAAAYQRANVDATTRVARAAARAGVRTFVFSSSVKVSGDATQPGHPFTPTNAPDPQDDYARSKLAAEQALVAIAANATMRAATLRLPLVYGPGVRGNFQRLWDTVARGSALPLASIANRRSMIGIDNLVDALLAALRAPTGVYFVADAQPVSTPALVRAIAAAQGRDARLWAMPIPILKIAGVVTGRSSQVARLTESLEVDIRSFVAATAWQAPRSLAEGLARMAQR